MSCGDFSFLQHSIFIFARCLYIRTVLVVSQHHHCFSYSSTLPSLVMSERPKRAVAPKSYKEVGISSDESPEEKPATKRKLPRQTPAIESKPPPKKKPKTNPTVLSSSSSSTHISPKLPQIPYTLEVKKFWLKAFQRTIRY